MFICVRVFVLRLCFMVCRTCLFASACVWLRFIVVACVCSCVVVCVVVCSRLVLFDFVCSCSLVVDVYALCLSYVFVCVWLLFFVLIVVDASLVSVLSYVLCLCLFAGVRYDCV